MRASVLQAALPKGPVLYHFENRHKPYLSPCGRGRIARQRDPGEGSDGMLSGDPESMRARASAPPALSLPNLAIARVRPVLTLREIGNSRFREGRGGDAPASRQKILRALDSVIHTPQAIGRPTKAQKTAAEASRPPLSMP
jgi:hypothetical protein